MRNENKGLDAIILDGDGKHLSKLCIKLVSSGYHIAGACAPLAALSHLSCKTIPLIVIDMDLEGHDPLRTGRIANSIAPHLQIVFTSRSEEKLRQASEMPLPVLGVLQKPFTPTALIRILEALTLKPPRHCPNWTLRAA